MSQNNKNMNDMGEKRESKWDMLPIIEKITMCRLKNRPKRKVQIKKEGVFAKLDLQNI